MGSFIHYKEGQRIGDCIYLRDAEWEIQSTGKRIRHAIFKCRCGKEFNSRISGIKNKHIISCGCENKRMIAEAIYKHGFAETSIYRRWQLMKDRCINKNNVSYKDYGGRGITIYKEWRLDFMSYQNYVSKLPNYMKKGYSLDRIDNNGNYEPSNLRWADQHTQSVNTRTRKDNTSGYKGVYYRNRGRKKWYSEIKIYRKKYYIGSFNTPREAAIARDRFIIKNNINEYSLQCIHS